MRTTTTARIGASAAGALLALGIFAAAPPAEASSGHAPHGVNSAGTACFTATGKTQGRSHSDPDGMSNGGADKPGCTGGFDADRDGNNGCGNDADREDDNNGNCGRQKTGPKARAAAPSPAVKVEAQQQSAAPDTPKVKAKHDEGDDEVLGDRQHGCAGTSGSSTTPTTIASTSVAGVALTSSGNCGCVLGAAAFAAPAAATLTAVGSTPSASAATTVSAAAATSPGTGATEAGSTGPAGTEVAAADTTTTTPPGTVVLGENLTRPSSTSTSTKTSTLPGALARTGAALGGLALVGAGLAGTGRLAAFSRRFLPR